MDKKEISKAEAIHLIDSRRYEEFKASYTGDLMESIEYEYNCSIIQDKCNSLMTNIEPWDDEYNELLEILKASLRNQVFYSSVREKIKRSLFELEKVKRRLRVVESENKSIKEENSMLKKELNYD